MDQLPSAVNVCDYLWIKCSWMTICPGCIYRIAGNFHWVQIFADKAASAKRKNKWRSQLMTSLHWPRRLYVDMNKFLCEQVRFLQSVCPLNDCCRTESACSLIPGCSSKIKKHVLSACYYARSQWHRKRRSEVEASSDDSFSSTSQLLAPS